MRSASVFLLSFAVAAVLGGPLAEGSFSDALRPLESELEIREAGLADATDPAGIRQLRAVERSLDLMRSSASLSSDCRAWGAAVPMLVRSFRSEFTVAEFPSTDPPSHPPVFADLSVYVDSAAQGLSDAFQLARRDLSDRAEGLREPTASRVQRQIDAADRAYRRALRASGFRPLGNRLGAAAAAIERGHRIADADPFKH